MELYDEGESELMSPRDGGWHELPETEQQTYRLKGDDENHVLSCEGLERSRGGPGSEISRQRLTGRTGKEGKE